MDLRPLGYLERRRALAHEGQAWDGWLGGPCSEGRPMGGPRQFHFQSHCCQQQNQQCPAACFSVSVGLKGTGKKRKGFPRPKVSLALRVVTLGEGLLPQRDSSVPSLLGKQACL